MKTQKTDSAFNQQHILGEGIASLMEYTELKYQCAMDFLSNYYKSDPRMYSELERDSRFWNWWANEWDAEEQDVINMYAQVQIHLTNENWINEMRVLSHMSRTEKSFLNYLKIFRNVRIQKANTKQNRRVEKSISSIDRRKATDTGSGLRLRQNRRGNNRNE